jgi:hypothetical protein
LVVEISTIDPWIGGALVLGALASFAVTALLASTGAAHH